MKIDAETMKKQVIISRSRLEKIQPQKDFLLVMADFFIYRNLHITTPSFHG